MRTFIAFDVPDSLARRIGAVQRKLTVGRMVPRENLHVMLAFLDDQPEAVLSALGEELAGLSLPRFTVQPTGFGHFGKARPRLAYLGIAPEPGLLVLHQAVRRASRAAGIVLSNERYVPHITIARYSGKDAGAAVLEVERLAQMPIAAEPFEVFGFGLYQSELMPDGPRYEVIESFPLSI